MNNNAKKTDLIITGKAKKMYNTTNKNQVIMQYTNHITAGNGAKEDTMQDKGKINCEITKILFEYLKENGIKHHIIKSLSETEMLCQKLTIFPLEVIARNYAKGSLVKKLGIKEYTKFDTPIVECSYKNDSLNDPLITERQIVALKFTTKAQLEYIFAETEKINLLLSKLFAKSGITLLDFKIEFGVNSKNEILLADEISPDCMRLENLKTNEIFDKDIYRLNKGNVIDGYRKFLGVLKSVK